jgi:hypothetical protein
VRAKNGEREREKERENEGEKSMSKFINQKKNNEIKL